MATVVGMAALPRVTAQDAESLTVEVGDCAELASREARLACFDEQVEAARRARPGSSEPDGAAAPSAPPANASPPPANASAAPPVVRSERARTAAPNPGSNERRDSRDSEPVEVVTRVAELRETVPNTWLITLDNGQVWRQTRPEPYPLRLGYEVRIYSSKWGYRLTHRQLRGFIQVERVR
jgi:hypothetical protein